MRDGQRGAVLFNHRLITCLFTKWKFLLGIIVDKMGGYICHYMSCAQNGKGKKIRGAKHQLLVDSRIQGVSLLHKDKSQHGPSG